MSKMKKRITALLSGLGSFFILMSVVGVFAGIVRHVSPMLKIIK